MIISLQKGLHDETQLGILIRTPHEIKYFTSANSQKIEFDRKLHE